MVLTFINKSELTGTVTASAAYQDVVNTSRAVNLPAYVEGWVDLSKMAIDDAINVQERVWINSSHIEFEEQNISNVQNDPALHFHSKFCPKSIYSVRINQGFGTLREYPYHFLILNMTT